MVCYAVEGGRVEFGEGGVSVLAVETFLVAVDPILLVLILQGWGEVLTLFSN